MAEIGLRIQPFSAHEGRPPVRGAGLAAFRDCASALELHEVDLSFRCFVRWDVSERSPKSWCSFLNQSLSHCKLGIVVITEPEVRFEQKGLELVAVEIGQRSCSPLISSVHRALFPLGLDICSYRVRPNAGGLVEHLVLERHGGGRIEGTLSADAKAAILGGLI